MTLLTGYLPTDLFAILAALIAVIIVYFKWSFGYWERIGVPTLPSPAIPFGHSSDLFSLRISFGEVFEQMYKKLKAAGHTKFGGFYLSSKPILLVLDPELLKNIMTRDFLNFTDHGIYVNEDVDPLTGNLFGLGGVKWRNLRTKLSPTFTSGKMKMMFQTLVNCSDELVNVMDEIAAKKEALDTKEIIGRFTTDVIGSCAFGIECNSLKNPNAEFRTHGKRIFATRFWDNLKSTISLTCPQILDFFRLPVTPPEVTRFFKKVVERTVKFREDNNVIRKDFMHLLIQLKNNVKIEEGDEAGVLKNDQSDENAGKTLNMNEIAAQAFVFFAAGFETSSTTTTFCLFELVSNPEIQTKLRDEITEILEKHEKITYDALKEMTYMDKCIYETLRKYPPAPVLARECTKTFTIPDTTIVIEKGKQLFVSLLGLHNDPEFYPEPEKFDPERFSPENRAKRHHFTWLPFGEGPRICIGQRFGIMQTKVALTVLLRRYKFTLNTKTKLPLTKERTSFILSPEGGVWLNVDKV